MKKIVAAFLIFASHSTVALAQNIYTAVQHQRKEAVRSGKARKIEEVNTNYGTNDPSTTKNVKILNNTNQSIQEESFENNKLTRRYKAELDSVTGLKLSRTLERWHPVMGYSIEKAVYHYNEKGYHDGVTDYNAAGQKVRETRMEVNEKGHPVKLAVYDEQGNLAGGYESAQYLYDENRYISLVVSADGRELSKDTAVIDFARDYQFKRVDEEFNQQGDVVKSKITASGYTLYEYKYDEQGNWIEEKQFQVRLTKNGKEKRKLEYVRTRKIEYWKE